MAAKTGFLKQGAADGLWNGCPTLDQPELCYGIVDHFLELSVGDTTSRWTLDNTNGTAVLGAAQTVGLGGVAVLNAPGTDNDWVSLKLTTADTGAPFKITKDSGKKLWFGARLAMVSIVETCWYVGLFGEASTEVGADDDGAENLGATEDGVYWRDLLHGTSDKPDFCVTKNGAETIVKDGAITQSTTFHNYGFYFDGASTIYPFIDDVGYTTVAADATNFPHDVGLTPLVFLKAGTAASKTVYVDWIKCVQLV
jgi:hypothetical protein